MRASVMVLSALVLVLGASACEISTAMPNTDGPTPDTPGDATLACQGEDGLWRVPSTGGEVTITVDTVSADTTFDPSFDIFRVEDWPATPEEFDFDALEWFDYSDDAFPCAFPPPTYECPELSIAVPEDFLLVVRSLNTDECAAPTVNYSLSIVDVNGPVSAEFLGNVASSLPL